MENLTPEVRQNIVHKAAGLLREQYAFPEMGDQMAARIESQWEQGAYDAITKKAELGEQLTNDCRELSYDFHLAIYFSPPEAATLEEAEKNNSADDDRIATHWWEQLSVDNYGLPKVEILAGNIGYLDIRYFAPISLAGNRAAAAMEFLSDCAALIFDLRKCGGGDPYTVQLFESYLFGEKPKLLLTFYDRPEDETEQVWTLPYIPGKRLTNVPVYILTSGRTFSGGEDFSYTLKHHGRATIVGENTGGGGHIVEFMSLGEGFVITLPTGYPTHPVTGENWEGSGVEPDIAVPREQALQTAHIHALETLLKSSPDEIISHSFKWELERAKAVYQPLHLSNEALTRFIGVYGGYEVTFDADKLTLSRRKRKDGWELIPITEFLFIADDEYNARFEIDDSGQVTALIWLPRVSHQEIRVPRKAT